MTGLEPDRFAELLNARAGRDPGRIGEILGLIEQVWRKHPDMRLGQLVVNLVDPTPNPIFTIEDEALRDRLKSTLETGIWPAQTDHIGDRE